MSCSRRFSTLETFRNLRDSRLSKLSDVLTIGKFPKIDTELLEIRNLLRNYFPIIFPKCILSAYFYCEQPCKNIYSIAYWKKKNLFTKETYWQELTKPFWKGISWFGDMLFPLSARHLQYIHPLPLSPSPPASRSFNKSEK